MQRDDNLEENDNRQAWIAFSTAAIAGLAGVTDDDTENGLMDAKEVADIAAEIADEMIILYLKRVESGFTVVRRRPGRPRATR